MCPSDYPFFYDSLYKTSLLIGNKYKWRIVKETLLTYLFSVDLFKKYKKNIRLVGTQNNTPFEKPLHDVYEKEICIAPINSLCHHISRSSPSVNDEWSKTWNFYFTKFKNMK